MSEQRQGQMVDRQIGRYVVAGLRGTAAKTKGGQDRSSSVDVSGGAAGQLFPLYK